MRTPSRCRSCKRILPWAEKIPIYSWLGLRGRCAGCGASIPARLWGMEVACACVPVLAMWRAETNVELILGTALLWVLAGLALCDATRYRLPDPLMLGLYAVGCAIALNTPGLTVLAAMVDVGVGLGVALAVRWSYWLWRRREGLGFGDVLLFGGLALAMGAVALPMIALLAATGALAGAMVASWRKGSRVRPTAATPFGAWLCLAAGCVWVFGL